MSRLCRVLCMAACLGLAVASQACAGAAWFYEQGTPDQGTSVAGRVALAKDASTAYGNPAGMTYLNQTPFMMGAGAMVLQSEFETEPGTTESGGGHDLTSALPLMTGHFVYSVSPDFKLGLAVNPLMGAVAD